MVESSVHGTLISEGYAAFNANDLQTAIELFCEDVPNSDNPEFPVWYPMHHGDGPEPDPIRGRAAILRELEGLRGANTKAKLLAVAGHGHTSVTLDIKTGGGDSPHACADEIEFDKNDRIKSFRHCAAGLHKHAGSSTK